MTDQPRITLTPDGGALLHLPEITYLDTQVWAVDIGLTADGLRDLRAALVGQAATEATEPADCQREPCREAAAKLAAFAEIDRGYCDACGRGDLAPTAEQWYEQQRRADKAEAQLATFALIFEGFGQLLTTSSRDWGAYRVDAWLWAVILGWDCDTDCGDDCDHDVLEQFAREFGWDDAAVAKARRYHAAVRALPEPTP